MTSLNIQLPADKRAFDHPATRETWFRARRRRRTALTLWITLWFAVLVAFSVLSEAGLLAQVHPAIMDWTFITLFFVSICTVYAPFEALSCLGRIRRILESEPWRPLEGARRREGIKDVHGVAVQLRLEADYPVSTRDGWSDLLTARDPIKRRRWPQELENGAWFAGSMRRGVLTVPGGGNLLEVRFRP